MHAGSDYMLPPCSLPNRCSPTCACGRGYGTSEGGRRPLSTGQKVFFAVASLLIGSAFTGAHFADRAMLRRIAEQEEKQRIAAERYVRNR